MNLPKSLLAAFAGFEQRLRRAPPDSDRASDLLDRRDRWMPYLEALSTYINGAELEQLSVRDYLAYADAETGVNWRVVDLSSPAGSSTLLRRSACSTSSTVRLRAAIARRSSQMRMA